VIGTTIALVGWIGLARDIAHTEKQIASLQRRKDRLARRQ
jgi:hypothetical protein